MSAHPDVRAVTGEPAALTARNALTEAQGVVVAGFAGPGAGAVSTRGARRDWFADDPIAAAEPFDVPPAGDLDEHLAVDAAAAFLGDWYGFAASVLEELRADPESTETSRVELWPEHVDAAFDALSGRRRAGFGASPGDAAVDEPYLYVVPFDFDTVPASDVSNAETFRGAIFPLSEFVDRADQRAAALTFFRQCRDALSAVGS